LTVPTKIEFETFPQSAKWVPKAEWIESAKNIPIARLEIIALLTKVLEKRFANRKKLYSDPVMQWFMGQPNVPSGFETLYGKNNKTPTIVGTLAEHYANRAANRILKYFQDAQAKNRPDPEYIARKSLRWDIEDDWNRFELNVL
jgi:hypothetical protein